VLSAASSARTRCRGERPSPRHASTAAATKSGAEAQPASRAHNSSAQGYPDLKLLALCQ